MKYVQLDNAGEKVEFAKVTNRPEWMLGLTMEFSGPGKPQRNYLAEVGFAVIWGRARAMMEDANIPDEAKRLLYREAISHACKMDNFALMTIKGVTKTRYEHMFGRNPKFTAFLHTWGEAGVVKDKQGRSAKLWNKGSNGMFVGHAQDCAGDNYHMYVPRSNSIQTTRNVQWIKRMHYRQPVQKLVGTIDSIELVNRAGVIGKIQNNDRHQGAVRTDLEPTKDGKGEDRESKEGVNTIPKR